jgi:transcription-repair coupling factor (superfamily II helicase)
LTQTAAILAASNLFAEMSKVPAVQSVARRLEHGGVFSFSGIASPAWPFFAALLKGNFPQRPIVVVVENLKAQESFQQDLETWLAMDSSPAAPLLFFPEWEIFPHEGKLPHSDVISDRLQTLTVLSEKSLDAPRPLVVTSVTALLQKNVCASGSKKTRAPFATRR